MKRAAWWGFVQATALALASTSASGQTTPAAAAAPAIDSAATAAPPTSTSNSASLWAMGRALYHGQQAWSVAPQLSNDVALPVDAAACGRCHGPRGEGAREGGVQVPTLRGIDAAATLHAATLGRTADGRPLGAPMPRYRFTAQELQALSLYLAQLGSASDSAAGVDPDAIHLATLMPSSNHPAAPQAAQALQAMQTVLARVNAAGGVYGRNVQLQVFAFEPGADAPPDALLHALQKRQVFALIGSFLGPVPQAWTQALVDHQTPMVANLLLATQPSSTPWVTHLVPALSEQLKQATAALKQRCGDQALWLVQPALSSPPKDDLASPLGIPAERVITGTQTPEAAQCVLSLLPPKQHAALKTYLQVKQPSAVRRSVTLGTLAMVSGPASSNDTVGLAELSVSPKLPAPQGAGVWAALGELAARTALEALSRSGRDLHPLALRRALESMHGHEPMPGVTLQYAPHQRAGLALASHWRPLP